MGGAGGWPCETAPGPEETIPPEPGEEVEGIIDAGGADA